MLGKRIINTATGAAPTPSCTTDTVQILGDTSCIAYYKMSDATDETGSYDGTPTNVNFNVAGKFGNAGEFNGSSSYISLPSGAPFNDSDDIKCISAWIKPSTSTSLVNIYSFSSTTDSKSYFNFNWDNNNSRVQVRSQAGASSSRMNAEATITPTTNWVHVMAQLGTNAIEVWVNGVEQNLTFTNSGSATNTSWISYPSYGTGEGRIGLYRIASPLGSDGSIDQVRIFNKAITANEVETLYDEVQCIPTIVPTDYFNTVIYTGNRVDASTTNPQTVGFQPDFVWQKIRTQAYNHILIDSIRGGDSALYSNATSQETNGTTNNFGGIDFVSNGVIINSANYTVDNLNKFGDDMVIWNWKAGGAAVSNTDGTITSQVSANTDAGFSIVKYSSGSSATGTVGHGLSQPPELVIQKSLGVDNWFIANNALSGTTNYEYMLFTTAKQSTNWTFWDGASAPTSTTFKNGWDGNREMINYCFHSVDGYSKIGSYVGSSASNSIVTGFRPAFVMIKRTNLDGGRWIMVDNKRGDGGFNVAKILNAQDSLAEFTASTYGINFHSNGFSIPAGASGNINSANNSYIFLAIAEENVQPEPELANSFNVVTYTGNGGTKAVTGLGFQPDLVWIKSRGSIFSSDNNNIFDSVRGAGKVVFSDLTIAEMTLPTQRLTSFDSNGFTTGSQLSTNNGTYVAWAWKASNDSTINNEGSISSVVSANPAAGFSVVKYTGTGSLATVGHGLSSAPELFIIKNLDDSTRAWLVYDAFNTATNNMTLNTTAASAASSAAYNNTEPTSTAFTINTSTHVNSLNDEHIAYAFHSVDGYQKVGSYTGTNAAGNFIETGFEPRFLLTKRSSAAGGGWNIFDSTRGTDKRLYPHLNNSEGTSSPEIVTFNSNGFTFNTADSWNNGSYTYIYLAIA